MKKTLIAAAALGLVVALGGGAQARPHYRHHRRAVAHMGHARAPRHAGRFHPSPVQSFLTPMFRYAYHH